MRKWNCFPWYLLVHSSWAWVTEVLLLGILVLVSFCILPFCSLRSFHSILSIIISQHQLDYTLRSEMCWPQNPETCDSSDLAHLVPLTSGVQAERWLVEVKDVRLARGWHKFLKFSCFLFVTAMSVCWNDRVLSSNGPVRPCTLTLDWQDPIFHSCCACGESLSIKQDAYAIKIGER